MQVDGSGLPYDFFDAGMIATLLGGWQDPRHHDASVATLPIAGRGTISTRMKDTRAERRARQDGVDLERPRAVGYVRTRDGETLCFHPREYFTIPRL